MRSRIYVTDIELADAAARAMGKHFRDARPATTLIAVNRLARPTQLIEIELDAVDDAKDKAERVLLDDAAGELYGCSHAVRMDERVYIGGAITPSCAHSAPNTQDLLAHSRGRMGSVSKTLPSALAQSLPILFIPRRLLLTSHTPRCPRKQDSPRLARLDL